MSSYSQTAVPAGGLCWFPALVPGLLVVGLLCFVQAAAAQGRGPGGGGMGGNPGGMGGSPSGMSRGMSGAGSVPENRSSPPGNSIGNGPTNSTMRGGLQLGPPGRWWDDGQFAHSLGLDSKQQHRMDDVFSANKGTLVKLFRTLQHEESQLEKVTRGKELDENQIFQQIDRVTQARGELEKANAHYLLQIRKEMTPEQTALLDEHRNGQ